MHLKNRGIFETYKLVICCVLKYKFRSSVTVYPLPFPVAVEPRKLQRKKGSIFSRHTGDFKLFSSLFIERSRRDHIFSQRTPRLFRRFHKISHCSLLAQNCNDIKSSKTPKTIQNGTKSLKNT